MSEYDCSSCDHQVCRDGVDCYDVSEEVMALYTEASSASRQLVEVAAEVEAEGYMRWPRAFEIIRFAQKAHFTHLGVAFCIGLHSEARTYCDILKRWFQVSSVCCKVCGLDKSELALSQLRENATSETMCSPLGQAELLNEAGTDLNIIIGLCVGHDALFSKHSNAPVTTLVAKDRVLAHNPIGALYSGYWTKKLSESPEG